MGDKKKFSKKILMIPALFIIGILYAVTFIVNKEFNENAHTIEFQDGILESGKVHDHNLSVRIYPRGYDDKDLSSWYHTYHVKGQEKDLLERHATGTIYEMEIVNLTDDEVASWNAEIYMPVDTMFNSGWNGVFTLHQYADTEDNTYEFINNKVNVRNLKLDYIYDQAVLLIPMHKGDYFTYEPSLESNEYPIAPSGSEVNEKNSKIIGFITYTENAKPDYVMTFSKGKITYRMHRSIFHENLFYVASVLLWAWLILAVAMLIVDIKMRQIKKEQQATAALVHKFEMDDLTNTFTRQAFFHYSEKLLENADKKYGVAIVEIDNFNIKQNQYGEKICSEFLIYLAEYLLKAVPNGYVGRYSRYRYSIIYEINDDFVIENILSQEMLQASPMPNQVLKISVYAPVDKNVTIRRCFDRAALALSKIRGIYGQNIVYYDDSLENQLLDNHKIEEYMEVALAERQFKVYYQPKHHTASKELIGAEALVRWVHPKYGFMPPNQFIPIFERTGFITKLDAYVFETVCRDIKDWQDKNLKQVPISINVSRKDFYEDDWIANRIALIDELSVDTKMIHVEVTESLYAEDTDVIKEKVDLLKEKGIKIEMDDFGSGYSSLGMLAGMSLDVLKLDISFVKDIEVTEVVVESIIDLAHKLKLSVIAEGVETENQFEIMKKNGCDYIQGYYFAKPMPKEEYEEYIK